LFSTVKIDVKGCEIKGYLCDGLRVGSGIPKSLMHICVQCVCETIPMLNGYNMWISLGIENAVCRLQCVLFGVLYVDVALNCCPLM
jgi:hypothetical protein